MNRYFYTIVLIVSFIILVFAMNIILEGGNSTARAIYRFSGENPRIGEISRAYRSVLLGHNKNIKDNLPNKENIYANSAEKGIPLTTNLSEVLPKDPQIGQIIDTTLAELKTTEISGNDVLAVLAGALNIDEEDFMVMYDRIINVPDITRLTPEEKNNAMVVELFARRDQIQTQIANYLTRDDATEEVQ